MENLPSCPECNSEYTYDDGNLLNCPDCFHAWSPNFEAETDEPDNVIRDANGNVLSDGDTVSVIMDLKVKGSSSIKRGTIVKNIKLIHDPSDGVHNISCKVPGFGGMFLKSSVVKKV